MTKSRKDSEKYLEDLSSTKKRNSIVLWLIMSAFVLTGVVITGYFLYALYQSQQASSWPTVIGTINECELIKTGHGGGRGGGGTTFHVAVNYSYEVAGQKYVGDRIAFGYCGSDFLQAHSPIHSKLSTARTVTVRYNPSDASVSVLTYGINLSTLDGLCFGLVWLTFMTGVCFVITQTSKDDRRVFEAIVIVSTKKSKSRKRGDK